MNFIKLNMPTDKLNAVLKSKKLHLVWQTEHLPMNLHLVCPFGDKYYLVLEDVFENFYIGGEVTISLNNGDYKITNIDTTNIGMLTDI